MRRFVLLLCVGLLLGGCAAKAAKPSGPKPTGFASADAKDVHDFLMRYPAILMSGDVKAIKRLYTDDARIVPLMGGVNRPIRAGEMSQRLPEIVAEERQADLRVVFHEPMQIEVKGERAAVRVVASLSWQEKGKPKKAVMSCYFGLIQDEHYVWRIREAHGEPVKPGFVLPRQAAPKKPLPPRDPRLKPRKVIKIKGEPEKKPAPPPAPPAPPDTSPPVPETPPAPAPDAGQNPQPLF